MIITSISRVKKELAFLFLTTFLLENYAIAKIYNEASAHSSWYLSAKKANQRQSLLANLNFNKGRSFINPDVQKKEAVFAESKFAPKKVFIGGPGQPEMQSFQATGVSNMVDLFSGDFSYNIPLMDVGGYPINIHYSSGISMDQDASWVGLGWNINPGTISRNMRGLPDDFNGKDSVTKTLNIKPNISVGITGDFNPEIFGKEIKLASASTSLEYNNYTGIGLSIGFSPTINSGKFAAGSLTASLDKIDFSIGSKTGVDIQANFTSQIDKRVGDLSGFNTSLGLNFNSRRGLDIQLGTGSYFSKVNEKNSRHTNFPISSVISFARASYTPTIQMPFTSFQFTFKGKGGGEIFGFHPLVALGGFYSQQYIAPADRVKKLPAFGYLHYQDANDRREVLLDYNRENDNTYTKNLPHIAVPVYTHDLFTVSGEGNGGMFRAYRGDVGYIRDPKMRSKNHSGGASVDIGGGNIVHFGADIMYNYSYTETNEWIKENSLRGTLKFRNSDTTFESVYFRNPGEKTTNARVYNEAVGGDDLIRVKLGNGITTPQASNNFIKYNDRLKAYATSSISNTTVKRERDKRTQVFTYLNAQEASTFGLDSLIAIYPENKFFSGNCDTIKCADSQCDTIKREHRINDYRKSHHISEIIVLNPDGKRYVYGIPVYNTKQTEVTFAVDKNNGNLTTGLVDYNSVLDDTTENKQGRDNFYSKEELPPYAHSYLLTGLVSSDYVDVKGDGISEDDIGDAVKFNYSRIFTKQSPYKWRAPFNSNKASYSENLRTDKSDDKAHYTYGEKEIWYLNSIESKTMLATFTLNSANEVRLDGRGVAGKSGGREDNQKLRYLKRIDLYSKADYIKNGTNARPVKTVHFAYSYKLCKGNPGSVDENTGKLTLDTIWFSYNGNNKGKKNPYVFSYHPNNPDYNARNVDRWGLYKNAEDNPGGMLNSEFPYALQDSIKASNNAGAWTLQAIRLPSGGKIQVDYESDDYGYVQNRRSTQMFRIAGFSDKASTPWGNINNKLYNNGLADQSYMYIDLPVSVSNKKELYEKYLQGLSDKLYFRVAVEMPSDSYGSGHEFVSGYCEWEDYNLVEAGTTNKAWIKLKKVKLMSPVTKAAFQFLRLNLPSKAYPGSDVKNDAAPKAVIKVLGSFASTIFQLLTSFEGSSKLRGWCKNIDLSKSIVRLANPVYKKNGGGLRVKRVLIYDNWNAMSGQKESFYGQEYSYTTTEEINGKKMLISSGVATYEPTVGNDENPFHIAMEYAEQTSLISPSIGRYIDNPVGETFYPSPSVGYSKVRVASIKRKNVKSATGYEETEFYTAKEFPVISDFTPFDRDSKRQFRSPLRFILRIDLRQYLTLSQGFRVQLNDMHGKMKSKVVFGENDTSNALSYVKNFYRVENQNATVKKLSNIVSAVDSVNGGINPNAEIGKDVELMVDMRQQISDTWGGNANFNVDMFIIPAGIFPIFVTKPSFFLAPNHELKQFRSVTVMKIVSRYGILDSVVQIDKGSKVSVKNLLYDAETGDVVLSRTQNEFDDPVYNFSYPAYQAYDALGLAYKNVGAVFNNMTITNGRLGNTYYDKFFTSGDEIMIKAGVGERVCGDAGFTFSAAKALKLWAINGTKIGKSSGIYFIDRNGKLFTGTTGNIKIIRSGRRNLLGEVGSVVSLASPIVDNGTGGKKLLFDNATNVINASAAEYKETWKVEDRFYLKDTSYIGTANGYAAVTPDSVITFNFHRISNGTTDVWTFVDTLNSKYIVSSYNWLNSINLNCYRSFDYRTFTNFKYDFSFIPANASITSANLSFADTSIPNQLMPTYNANCGAVQRTTYNWSAASTSNYGVSNVNLYRITAPWNIQTPITSFTSNRIATGVTPSVNNRLNLTFTQTVRDMINNPNYGLMLSLNNSGSGVYDASGYSQTLGYYSFATPDRTSSNYAVDTTNDAVIRINYTYPAVKHDTVCRSVLTQAASNPYITGSLGNWRPYRSYVYYDERKETDASTATNIRSDGTFKTFSPFWVYGSNGITAAYDSSKWVWNSEITKINRKGAELENKDPLGRYNAGLYGYNLALPIAVAQNARYKEIAFDGFEDYDFKNDLCTKPCAVYTHLPLPVVVATNLSTQERHSGKYSLKVNQNDSFGIVTDVRLVRPSFDTNAVSITAKTDTLKNVLDTNHIDKYCYDAVHTDSSSLLPGFSPIAGSKVVVGAWVKEAKDCACESYTENYISVVFKQVNGTNVIMNLKPSGNIIEGWQRIDSVITVPANTIAYKIFFKASPSSTTYFDDFRIQPFNSNMKSFVYSSINLRLMAELDENNYATYYEYDDDGTLIRVKKETQKGIKTIKETRSALLKQ
jgi:hypothetical protein